MVLLVKHMPAFTSYVGDIRDLGSIPGLGRSLGGGYSNPLPVLLPGESHEQRSLLGCSPWGHTEWDTSE